MPYECSNGYVIYLKRPSSSILSWCAVFETVFVGCLFVRLLCSYWDTLNDDVYLSYGTGQMFFFFFFVCIVRMKSVLVHVHCAALCNTYKHTCLYSVNIRLITNFRNQSSVCVYEIRMNIFKEQMNRTNPLHTFRQ